MRAGLTFLLLLTACARPQSNLAKPQPPETIVLWAWDRAEDLRFLKPGEAEVAALMRTLYLRNGNVEQWRRKLPLLLPEGVQPIEVTRFESDGTPLPPAEQFASHFSYEKHTEFRRLQFDFDVRASQIPWYRELLEQTKTWKSTVSITSIVSNCLENPWSADLSIEVVPMLFRMGPQRGAYLAKLQTKGAFANGCRGSLGISTDEPLAWRPPAKRIYVFNPNRWTRESFDQIRSRLR